MGPPEPIPLATATVRVDLSYDPGLAGDAHDHARHDRFALLGLDDVPDGARVVVWIGDRTWCWPDVVQLLHRHAQRLVIELQGSTSADLRRWIGAVRTGRDEVFS